MPDLNAMTTWKVLLVDDEPDNLELISEALEFYGLTVRTAENGITGLDLLKSFKPDAILLDLSMPKMDGWDMQKRLKANAATKDIPVIAISAHAMLGDREKALRAGFDGYLTKPVSIVTLLDDMKMEMQGSKVRQAAVAAAAHITILPSSEQVAQNSDG